LILGNHVATPPILKQPLEVMIGGFSRRSEAVAESGGAGLIAVMGVV